MCVWDMRVPMLPSALVDFFFSIMFLKKKFSNLEKFNFSFLINISNSENKYRVVSLSIAFSFARFNFDWQMLTTSQRVKISQAKLT